MATVVKASDYVGAGIQFPIASAVTVNEGDLVGLDNTGAVVLADNTTGPVKCRGFAVFPDDVGIKAARVGTATGSVKCAIARCGTLSGFSSQTIDGDVFLDTAGGYTQSAPATAGMIYQKVGYAIAADTVEVLVTAANYAYQDAGATTLAFRGAS